MNQLDAVQRIEDIIEILECLRVVAKSDLREHVPSFGLGDLFDARDGINALIKEWDNELER